MKHDFGHNRPSSITSHYPTPGVRAVRACAVLAALLLCLAACGGPADLDDGDGEPELEQRIDNQDAPVCSDSGRFCIVQCGAGGTCVRSEANGVVTFTCGC